MGTLLIGQSVKLNDWAKGLGRGLFGVDGKIMLITKEYNRETANEYVIYHVNTGKRIVTWSEHEIVEVPR